MMRLLALIAAMLITFSLAACGASQAALPTGNPPGPWKLKFDDEFNSQSLNTADWSTGWFGSGITEPVNPYELECYNPANMTVSGGTLVLSLTRQAESCGGTDRPYSSGMVNSDGKFEFTYGFIEARIWMPGQGQRISNWPAFWADGQNWPKDGEIDIMEGLVGQACWHFFSAHSSDNPGGCVPGSFTAGWHTFGADWAPGTITYYYDGRVVGRVTSGVTSAPMFLILNYAISNRHRGPVQVPATMRVDYVRVWQHLRKLMQNPASLMHLRGSAS